MILRARDIQPSDIDRLGTNAAAAIRNDRRGHLSAAERSLGALGELVDWLDPRHDDDDPDAGAAGVLVPA